MLFEKMINKVLEWFPGDTAKDGAAAGFVVGMLAAWCALLSVVAAVLLWGWLT